MRVCPGPSVREVALSQSVPTPSTRELFRVVTSVAVGAPGFAFALCVAPIAPEPFETGEGECYEGSSYILLAEAVQNAVTLPARC